MMIFHRERLVYLAVPKTATSAVEQTFGPYASSLFRDPPGLKHTNARRFERRFRPIVQHGDARPYETIAVIREPVEWLQSWYRYRQRPKLDGHPNSSAGKSFQEFVEEYLSDKPQPFAKVGAQSRFLCDDHGELLVNHLFCYERIDQFTAFLNDRLGKTERLGNINISPQMNGADFTLPRELEDDLRTAFLVDYQLHRAVSDAPLTLVADG